MFLGPKHQRPNFDGFINTRYAAPPSSARISAICLLPFGKVWLTCVWWPPCATPSDEAERRIYGGCSKTPVLFYPVCGPKFMKFCDNGGNLLTPIPDCLCHVSFRRYSRLSLEVMENGINVNVFWPPIFGRDDPHFLQQTASAIYCPHQLNFGWVPFAGVRVRSLAMKYKQNLHGAGKNDGLLTVQFEAVCGQKFMTFWDYGTVVVPKFDFQILTPEILKSRSNHRLICPLVHTCVTHLRCKFGQ